MENPLYSGQSMLPPGGWWELFCLLSANGWFVFFFWVSWPVALEPVSFFGHHPPPPSLFLSPSFQVEVTYLKSSSFNKVKFNFSVKNINFAVRSILPTKDTLCGKVGAGVGNQKGRRLGRRDGTTFSPQDLFKLLGNSLQKRYLSLTLLSSPREKSSWKDLIEQIPWVLMTSLACSVRKRAVLHYYLKSTKKYHIFMRVHSLL